MKRSFPFGVIPWVVVTLVGLGGFALGCGGPSAATETPPPASTVLPETLHRANLSARQGSTDETIHGTVVHDPYRSLENDTPKTQAWIDLQTSHAEERMDQWTGPGTRNRLTALLRIPSLGGATVGGDRTFFTRRDGDREQPALFVAKGTTVDEAPLVDPLTFGERASLDWYFPSPQGRYLAYGISANGDEKSTLHVIDVDSRQALADRIAHTRWCNIAWLPDESGFYYTRYPSDGEDGFDSNHPDTYFPRVYFHALGSPEADPLIYGSEKGTDFPFMSLSPDGRWMVFGLFRGWSATDLFLFDRGKDPKTRLLGPDEKHPLTTITQGESAVTVGTVFRDRLYLLTNHDAPRYRIATVPVKDAGDTRQQKDLIPEGEATIEDWGIIGGKVAVHHIEQVESRLRIYDLDGKRTHDVALPRYGSIDGLAGTKDHPHAVVNFSSYTTPPTLVRLDVASGTVDTIAKVETDIDLTQYVVERATVTSKDGTPIPVTLVHGKEFERNGNHPVLLNGYGGFNVSLLPHFSRNALYWVERGGVYAVANLRGGGEFGETWHRAGMLDQKPHVFEDFESVIRWFSTDGISNPDRIAIMGGSNGGLLMGAMITRCPDAFRAAVSSVGLYDMVRYHRFPPAELWVSEYGSAEDATQFAWLHAYSPYHRVKNGTPYPAVLVETADHDGRVFWGHSTKFAARLQEASSSEHPILFHMERKQGHGRGTRLSDMVDAYVGKYSFIEHELGLPTGPR